VKAVKSGTGWSRKL